MARLSKNGKTFTQFYVYIVDPRIASSQQNKFSPQELVNKFVFELHPHSSPPVRAVVGRFGYPPLGLGDYLNSCSHPPRDMHHTLDDSVSLSLPSDQIGYVATHRCHRKVLQLACIKGSLSFHS